MQFKAVLWDMDGTLIESESLYGIGLAQTNQKYQITLDDEETLGVSLHDLWQRLTDSDKQKLSYREWADEIQAYVDAHFHRLKIFERAHEVLQAVHARAMPQSCVSNNNRRFIEQVLTYNQVTHLFHHWIGHDDVTYSKPHPEPYQQSAKRLQVEPSDCLAVEDSVVGVLSAKAAGMKVALYCPKNTPAPAVNADYVIDCHRELLELLEE